MEMVYRKVPRKFLVFKMAKGVAGEMALLLRASSPFQRIDIQFAGPT